MCNQYSILLLINSINYCPYSMRAQSVTKILWILTSPPRTYTDAWPALQPRPAPFRRKLSQKLDVLFIDQWIVPGAGARWARSRWARCFHGSRGVAEVRTEWMDRIYEWRSQLSSVELWQWTIGGKLLSTFSIVPRQPACRISMDGELHGRTVRRVHCFQDFRGPASFQRCILGFRQMNDIVRAPRIGDQTCLSAVLDSLNWYSILKKREDFLPLVELQS